VEAGGPHSQRAPQLRYLFVRFYQALLCPDIAKRYDFVRAQLSRIGSGYIDDNTPRSWARMGR
jgi:hypothetical protein